VGQLVFGLSKSAGVEMGANQKARILSDLRDAYGQCVRDPAGAQPIREEQELSLVEQQKLAARRAKERSALPPAP
jgi:hypothetical protein